MQATTPVSPRDTSGKMFARAHTFPMVSPRTLTARPLSEATEIFDTDGENESEFEESHMLNDQPPSPRESIDSDDSRRRSQTTVSSYEEAPTPDSSSGRSRRRPFEIQIKPVEGPKGPHLFRSSQISTDSSFDYALQMSPLLPKHPPPRTETAFSQNTVTSVSQQPGISFSIDAIMRNPPAQFSDAETEIRKWNSTQVIDWMVDTGIDESVIECFEVNDINGAILMELTFDNLKEIGIQSFGKRHQLWNAISAVQGKESVAPEPTPFQDISRPCTTNTKRSPSRGHNNSCETPIDCDMTPIESGKSKKRRGRKAPKTHDVTTPLESVSIVAIEQLLPKPHTCAKEERCAKWRKQQRELRLLHEENGIGRFPISPTKGGRIFVHGDPGNAATAQNIVPREVERQAEDFYDPHSEVIPSIVASSDVFGPSQIPAFALHEGSLEQIDRRDPQENVKHFLNFQHMQTPISPMEDQYLDGTLTPIERPATSPTQRRNYDPLPLFPAEHLHPSHPGQPMLQPPQHTPGPHQNLKALPKLAIPRPASAGPQTNHTITSPDTSNVICRSTTASPGAIYRLGTPASEMDVPVTYQSPGPIERDASQSVPPSMQFREQQQLARSHSRAQPWHRPSFALPAVKEGEVFSPASEKKNRPSLTSTRTDSTQSTRKSSTVSIDSTAANSASTKAKDPAHHSPQTQHFGYGADCTHAGWMRKRKTRMLRHEWQEAHFRLNGTQLAMHANDRLQSAAVDTIDVDHYAVACSTAPSGSKLSAAFKGLHIKSESKGSADPAPFAFQLVPNREGGGAAGSSVPAVSGRKAATGGSGGGKTHHFAVKHKDERIDWMRELMLAKALQQKGKGYEVEVYGGQQA